MQREGTKTAPPPFPPRPAALHARAFVARRPSHTAPPVSQTGITCAVALLDICAIISAALLARAVTRLSATGIPLLYEKVVLLTIVISLALFGLARAYRTQALLSQTAFPRFVLLLLPASAAVISALYLLGQTHTYSLRWHAVWLACALIFVPGFRALLALAITHDPQQRLGLRTIIIGGGEHGLRLMQTLQHAEDHSLRLVGYVDDRQTRLPSEQIHLPFLGSTEQMFDLIRNGLVDQVILALPGSADTRTLDLLDRLADHPVHVRLAPDLISYHLPAYVTSDVQGLPLMHLRDRPISGWAQMAKRTEDLVLATLVLALLALPMLVIALAIRLNSPGPILFRQRRIGFNSQAFEMLKFRTMHHDQAEYTIGSQATPHDMRITRVGFWLRRLSLDELPQIFNVLRGDMSLVGPRPHAPGTQAAGRPFEMVVAHYAARHRVKPGLTGLAQVRGYRGLTETEESIRHRVESDMEYIENWSPPLDLLILMRTIFIVLRMKNAW